MELSTLRLLPHVGESVSADGGDHLQTGGIPMIDTPDGITRKRCDRGFITHRHGNRGVKGYEELRVGRLTYEYEFDHTHFPLDRDYEVEWIDGPVRFRFERVDDRDHYKLWVYPAGSVTRWFRNSGSGGGSSSWESVIIYGPDDLLPSGDDDPTPTAVRVSIDLTHNPLSIDRTSSEDVSRAGTVAGIGSVIQVVIDGSDHRMVEDHYDVTPRMLAAQARRVIRDGLEKPVYEIRENGLSAVLTHYRNSRSVTERRASFSKRLATAKWKLGLREKPIHVAEREHRMEWARQRQYETQRPGATVYSDVQQPPGPPDETDNRCPDCGGRYHERDLEPEAFENDDANVTGTEWRCPDCGSVVGVESEYHGPVPVQIGPDQYELQ